MLIADVAVPVPLGRPFSYAVPAALAAKVTPGTRVLCQFGPRKTLGVVLEVADREPAFDKSKLRPIAAVVDDEPVLPPELLSFLRELSAYYLAPIGEVLRMALPALERTKVAALRQHDELGESFKGRKVGGRAVTMVRFLPNAAQGGAEATAERAGTEGGAEATAERAGTEGGAEATVEHKGAKEKAKSTRRKRAAKSEEPKKPRLVRGQALEVLEYLAACPETSVPRLEQRWKGARAAVKRLEELGLVELSRREVPASPFFAELVDRDTPPALNEAQERAAASLRDAIASREPRSFLLYGVTGSGKTEVYLRAIAACLAEGRGALVLVPEIALTPQLVGRFRARFGDGVAVIHSGLKERERHLMWQRLRRGDVRVAIGARSALFAPVPNLGLVVVDEEHDGSFKQEEGARYHARDMGLLRAHRARAVAVLGSATPSLETEMLCRRGKLARLELPERAHATAVLPRVEIVDLKRVGPGPSGSPQLSLPLHRAIDQALAAREQTILFLNRRGFAPSVLCTACGAIVRCELCSVALTFHRERGKRLLCHYCDFTGPLPEACPTCGRGPLALEGLGTEKLEAEVIRAFPGASVARLDRDVAAGARAEPILARVRSGEVDILVGTQMVAKGHDLPRVTLVGVINADSALSMPDYRAGERAFQLLVQVAGRAGRGDRPGTVIIQTRDPEHPAIVYAARHDVPGFIEREIAQRSELPYPPFGRLALLRVEGPDEDEANGAAHQIAEAARLTPPVVSGEVGVLGPKAAPLARLRGNYRFQVLVRSVERAPLRLTLRALLALRDRAPGRVRIVIDVDPVQMM